MKRFIPLIFLLAGCGDGINAPVAQPNRAEADAWSVIGNDVNAQPVFLGNHGFGVHVSPMGNSIKESYLMEDGSLYFCPEMADFNLSIRGNLLTSKQVVAYDGKLNFRTGEFRSHFHCVAPEGDAIEVVVKTVVDPFSALLAQHIELTAAKEIPIEISFAVQGPESLNVKGDQIREGEEWVQLLPVSKSDSLGEKQRLARWKMETSNGKAPKWVQSGNSIKFCSIANQETTTLSRVIVLDSSKEEHSKLPTFDQVSQRTKLWWEKKWKTDIVIDGPVEDQQAIRSFLFNLYQSENEKLPPMGLSNKKYNGHRFWDAEVWLLPVYALVSRDFAERATNWRSGNAPFPWEAGAKGTDVTPVEFKNAIHVNGWIAWWFERAFALGLATKSRRDSVIESVDKLFSSKASGNEIRKVISPDEGKKRNNDLVTNLLANWVHIRNPISKVTLPPYKIPTLPDGVPSTYDSDALKGYQQTAALLSIYPLEWSFGKNMEQKMFDRYKALTSDVGPAMSDSIHATIAARMGRGEEAYKFWRQSWVPFVREPWLSFCERRNSSDDYFLTGAAGSLQSVIYGFLGIRFEESEGKPQVPSKQLANGTWLSARPNLPKAWKSLTFKGVQLPAGRVTIRATANGVTIQDGG